jgi:hypothetical protein
MSWRLTYSERPARISPTIRPKDTGSPATKRFPGDFVERNVHIACRGTRDFGMHLGKGGSDVGLVFGTLAVGGNGELIEGHKISSL